MPDERMLLWFAAGPAGKLLLGRVRHEAERRADLVDDAEPVDQRLVLVGQVGIGGIGVGELGLAAPGRELARAEHRGERRDVEIGAVDVPEEIAEIIIDRDVAIGALLESHPVDVALADLAEGTGEGELLLIVDGDSREDEHPAHFEQFADLAGVPAAEQRVEIGADARADAGLEVRYFEGHRPSPSILPTAAQWGGFVQPSLSILSASAASCLRSASISALSAAGSSPPLGALWPSAARRAL